MSIENIGDRIRFLRKDHLNLTLKEMSEKLNVSLSNLGNIETGKINATPRFLADISREFGVNQTWLETGGGEMFKTPSIDEEIAEFVGPALNGNRDPFKRRVLLALSRMDEAGWQKAKEFLLMLKEEEEREMILDIKEKGTE